MPLIPNNLPPQSQQWVRDVEARLLRAEQAGAKGDVTDTAQNRTLQVAQQGLVKVAAQAARAAETVAGGYAENVAMSVGTSTDLYSNPVILTPPAWAKSASITALSAITITATGSRYATAFGYVYVAPNDPLFTYALNMSYMKRSQPFYPNADATKSLDPTSIYPNTGYIGPVQAGQAIYVGIGGIISGSGSGSATYTASTTAIAFWS